MPYHAGACYRQCRQHCSRRTCLPNSEEHPSQGELQPSVPVHTERFRNHKMSVIVIVVRNKEAIMWAEWEGPDRKGGGGGGGGLRSTHTALFFMSGAATLLDVQKQSDHVHEYEDHGDPIQTSFLVCRTTRATAPVPAREPFPAWWICWPAPTLGSPAWLKRPWGAAVHVQPAWHCVRAAAGGWAARTGPARRHVVHSALLL